MRALSDLAAMVARESGMRMGPNQMGSLLAALGRLGHRDAAAALRAATTEGGNPEIIQRLIDEVTIKETSFLRDAAQLATIEWPELLEGARRRGSEHVRVWSAACATGEEPYTLALLAAEALGSDARRVQILATDIAGVALSRARQGRYQPRALRNLDPALVARHFSADGGEFVVAPHLRQMVEFRQHNLVRDAIPPGGEAAFDLILCRNALIYFEAAGVERVTALLAGALRPGGTLLLGAADRLCVPRRAVKPLSPHATPQPVRRARGILDHLPERLRGGPSEAGTRAQQPGRDVVEGPPRGTRDGDPEPAGTQTPLGEAMRLADAGRLDEAVEATRAAVRQDPMNAHAHFVGGTAKLALGDAEAAVAALRRALYVDGTLALAAFQLGRAYDMLERDALARQAYERALRTFDPDDRRHDWLLGQVDVGDLAAACRARIGRAATPLGA
jgi:chemotaxis protein methyltransferase CheR